MDASRSGRYGPTRFDRDAPCAGWDPVTGFNRCRPNGTGPPVACQPAVCHASAAAQFMPHPGIRKTHLPAQAHGLAGVRPEVVPVSPFRHRAGHTSANAHCCQAAPSGTTVDLSSCSVSDSRMGKPNFDGAAFAKRLTLAIDRCYPNRKANDDGHHSLARASGVSSTVISRMVAGAREVRISTLYALSEGLPGVSIDWLLTGRGRMDCKCHEERDLEADVDDIRRELAQMRKRLEESPITGVGVRIRK